nr:cysteine-rich receptor-like protein kinase [Tanacetum cinerariifolium]GEW55262.1 cysteine-rich receptor-like protein kinase [Tanacetum cinerariifolium]
MKVDGKVVGDVQNAFIKRRYIIDGVLIANEFVDHMRKIRCMSLIFKVNFEKAFDSLNLRFLSNMMGMMGFENNGVCGLRVVFGHPESAEGLNVIMKEAIDKGIFRGMKIDRRKKGLVEEKGKWVNNVWRWEWEWEWVRGLRGMANSPVDVKEPEGSNDYTEVTYDKEQCLSDHYTAPITPPVYTPSIPFLATMEPTDTLLMGDEVISTILAMETDEFLKSSVDDLVPIPKESEVTFDSNLECDMPATTPLPPTDVRKKDFDINSPLGEYIVEFLMENVDVAGEFEDISSLGPPELTLVIDESTLLVTLPLPCTDVLGDAIVDVDLRLGDHLDTLSTRDREIDFNPSTDIEELERLLADDPVPVPVPRVFDKPLGNFDSMSRSSETSDLFEELITKFGLNDSISTKIDDRYHDSEGDILYFEEFLNEDTSSDVSPALLPT